MKTLPIRKPTQPVARPTTTSNTGNWPANDRVRKFLHHDDDDYAGATNAFGFIPHLSTSSWSNT
ncbi:hypothetical protein [Methylorubrum aminovorans]